MKNIILLILVLSFFGCDGQKKLSIENDYFLVGTLSDYMGREKYEKVEKRVDKYSQSEKQLCLAIDSIFKISNPDIDFSSSVRSCQKSIVEKKERHHVIGNQYLGIILSKK